MRVAFDSVILDQANAERRRLGEIVPRACADGDDFAHPKTRLKMSSTRAKWCASSKHASIAFVSSFAVTSASALRRAIKASLARGGGLCHTAIALRCTSL